MSEKTWDERARAALSQGCLTFSKRSDQNIKGVSPTHCTGEEVPDYPGFEGSDGRRYIDFSCGLGSNLIRFRNNFSIPSTKEVELAERLKALFPCMEKVKILKTGSAACETAVRFARAFTGRNEVWGTGYHGTSNVFIASETPGAGCVDEGYRKFQSLVGLANKIQDYHEYDLAAVIVEPIQLGLEDRQWIEEIRKECDRLGAVLIFDEIITGFRVPKYSFSNYFGIQPDLICLGKALGDGYPIAVLGGRDDIMETPGVFISNTHNGEVSAINAALETLDYLTEERLQGLWDRGAAFQKEFNGINPKVQIRGYPTRGELQGEEMFKALFMQEMARAGYFFGRAFFISFAHSQECLRTTLGVAQEVCGRIEAGLVQLEGKMPRPIFQRNS